MRDLSNVDQAGLRACLERAAESGPDAARADLAGWAAAHPDGWALLYAGCLAWSFRAVGRLRAVRPEAEWAGDVAADLDPEGCVLLSALLDGDVGSRESVTAVLGRADSAVAVSRCLGGNGYDRLWWAPGWNGVQLALACAVAILRRLASETDGLHAAFDAAAGPAAAR